MGRERQVAVLRGAQEASGQTEVQELDGALRGHLYVGGLEIAVQDVVFVGVLETGGDLLGDLQGVVDGNVASANSDGEILTLHQFHDQELELARGSVDAAVAITIAVDGAVLEPIL